MSRETAIKALKARMRREPTADEAKDFFIAIRRGNDRSTAILGASMVEENLKRAILAKLRPLTNDEKDRLFGPSTPLGSLSAKIKIGYALSLYDRATQQDLDTIREIRNAFAHDLKPLTFATPEIKDLCGCLHLPKDASRSLSRYRFLWAVSNLVGAFIQIARPDLAEDETSPHTH